MGEGDNGKGSGELWDYRSARDRLRRLTEELETVKEEISQLETRKTRLTDEKASLEARLSSWHGQPDLNSKAAPRTGKPDRAKPKAASKIGTGLFLALMSAVVLSIFNVYLKIIFQTTPQSSKILGIFEQPDPIAPGFGNALLILFLRMIVVMAVMPILATVLYPPLWQDIKGFLQSKDRAQMLKVVGSGFFLLLSQVCIYIAIGNIPIGVALTIFFIYPIVTVLASWGMFGDRPTIIRIIAMFVIGWGCTIALPSGDAEGKLLVGVVAAIAAGVTFASYVVLVGIGTRKLHPIPFNIMSFAAGFVFAALILMLPLPANLSLKVEPTALTGLLMSTVVLGVLTLGSYMLNNIAIRFAGPALASIIGTSGPALTALFGWIAIGEKLELRQWGGVGLVTLGVVGLSLERMFKAKRRSRRS